MVGEAVGTKVRVAEGTTCRVEVNVTVGRAVKVAELPGSRSTCGGKETGSSELEPESLFAIAVCAAVSTD